MDIDNHLAQRIRTLRKARQLTLEALADASGVSRSSISSIERAEASPTAAVLNKLADALGVSMAALFADEAGATAASPLSAHAQQQVWTDPASGYVRRQLTPAGYASPLELVEVTFPPGQVVAFDNPVRSVATHQLLWLLEGTMEITLEDQAWQLQAGDCLAMLLGQHIRFRNPGRKPARYALALTTTPQTAWRS